MRSKVFTLALFFALPLAQQMPALGQGRTQAPPPRAQENKTLTNPDIFDPLMPPIKLAPPDECQKLCAQADAQNQRRQKICVRACRKAEQKPGLR